MSCTYIATKYPTKLDTTTWSRGRGGWRIQRTIYEGKHRAKIENRNVSGWCNREAGFPGESRWQGDGETGPAASRRVSLRRRELTGLVADAGVVGKAKASESREWITMGASASSRRTSVVIFCATSRFYGPPPRPRTSERERVVFRPSSGWENFPLRCVMWQFVVVNEYRWAKWAVVVKSRKSYIDRLIVMSLTDESW